jgi:rod shape-determining protein MreD
VRGRQGRTALKVLAVLALGIVVQTTFGSDLRVQDVAPDFMFLLAATAGFCGGPDRGAVIGFLAGLLSDLYLLGTPFGLSALAGCLVGFSVGWARANVVQPRLAMAPVVAAAGTVLGVALFVVIGYLVGQAQLVAPGKRWLVTQAVIEACYSALFSLPAALLMDWALRRPRPPVSAAGELAPAGVTEFSGRRRSSRARRRRRAMAKVR